MDNNPEWLRREMRAGLESLKARIEERFDDLSEISKDRHEQNVLSLRRIEIEVRHTNGRVIRHDEQIRSLFKKTEQTKGDKGDTGEKGADAVTLDNLKWYIACVAGGFSAAFALLKLTGH